MFFLIIKRQSIEMCRPHLKCVCRKPAACPAGKEWDKEECACVCVHTNQARLTVYMRSLSP